MPQGIFIFAMVIAYILRRDNKFLKSPDPLIILLIMLLSAINFIYGSVALTDFGVERRPYFLAYLFAYILATQLKPNDLRRVALLIIVEGIIVFVEAFMGVNTLFTAHTEYMGDLDFGVIYAIRPFGLSDGTNSMGGKLLVAIVLLDYFEPPSWFKSTARMVLFSALIITFSRTAIFAALLHYAIFFAKSSEVKNKLTKLAMVIFLIGLIQYILSDLPWEILLDQLNRGKQDGVDLSYRDVIWGDCLKFIASHPFFGNGSSRYYVWLSDYGVFEHAHNSFLHLFATNGILIGSVMMSWILYKHNSFNVSLTIPIMAFSLGQYGIFWGISFIDIIFLFLIVKSNSIKQTVISDRYARINNTLAMRGNVAARSPDIKAAKNA